MPAKKPKTVEKPQNRVFTKHLEAESKAGNFDTMYIAWRFDLADTDLGWDCVFPSENFHNHFQPIKELGLQTWDKIKKSGSHNIEVGDLIPEARKRLESLRLDDIDELFSLRLGGEIRVFGIRNRHYFFPLWWDENHKICPSYKKGTKKKHQKKKR